MVKNKENSLIDEPAHEDRFGIDGYIKGISDFLCKCDTPLTMSVQGDWGTGKTSIMSMIRKDLEGKHIKTVWFNTWQFSQFNMEEQLSLSLIRALTFELSEGENRDKLLKCIAKIGLGIARGLINKHLGMDINEKDFGEIDERYEDSFAALSQLKKII